MAKKPRENRIPIMMSDEELTAVDDWRFENRVATRSDAVRRLCRLGMMADRSGAKLFKLVRSILDEDFLILDALVDKPLSADDRAEVEAFVKRITAGVPLNRTELILEALLLSSAVDAVRKGSNFDEAMALIGDAHDRIAEDRKEYAAIRDRLAREEDKPDE